jgi:murein DD-endopeptidase MepM/ murein hydrolase activator NlpD
MPVLSTQQALQYAYQAGFNQTQAVTAVAIATAESGLDTSARSAPNKDAWGSIDRGLYQINSHWHSEVSDAQAYDPLMASQAAYRISQSGQNFTPWSTYNSRAYTKYLQNVQAATGQAAANSSTNNTQSNTTVSLKKWTIADSYRTWPWICNPDGSLNTNNPWMSDFERQRGLVQYGIGIPTPYHTTITSLTLGTVLDILIGGYGIALIIESTIPNLGNAAITYLHLDTTTVKKGQTVKVGDTLGLSGGQNVGGSHPSITQLSTGPHTDIDVNNPLGGFHSLGPNVDPTSWLTNLFKNGPPAKDLAGSSLNYLADAVTLSDTVAHGTGPIADNVASICAAIDNTESFKTLDWGGNPFGWPVDFINWLINDTEAFLVRLLVVLIGVLMITAFILNYLRTPLLIAAGVLSAAQGEGLTMPTPKKPMPGNTYTNEGRPRPRTTVTEESNSTALGGVR